MALTREDFNEIEKLIKQSEDRIEKFIRQSEDRIEKLIKQSEDRMLGELGRDYKTFSQEIKHVHQRIERLHPEETRQF